MAEKTKNSIQDIRAREEARREARKARQRTPRTAEPKVKQDPIVALRLVLRVPAQNTNLRQVAQQGAYEGLASMCLTVHAPKYKHHDHRQTAVMKGELYVPNLPLSEANRIAQELRAYGWVRPAKEG